MPDQLEHKIVPFALAELKAEGDGWFVAGLASTWGGAPDSYSDVVAKGAFTDTLLTRPKVPLLWQHDMGDPIGKTISLVENDEGLLGKWSLIATDTGKKAHQLLTAELVTGLSIGFMTKEADYRDDGVRVLKAVDLYEVSLVTIGANPAALVSSFKADIPITTLLTQLHDGVRLGLRAVEALADRRTAEHRRVNDDVTAQFSDLAREVEALAVKLATPVVAPEAEAEELEAHALALRLEFARRRYAAILREA